MSRHPALRRWYRPATIIFTLIFLAMVIFVSLEGERVFAPRAGVEQPDPLNLAISRAQQCLLADQEPEGHWNGECYFRRSSKPNDQAATAAYVLLLHYLDIDNSSKERAIDYLQKAHLLGRTWEDAGADYAGVLALELAGVPDTSPAPKRIRQYIHEYGERLQDAGPVVQMFYAQFDRYQWQDIGPYEPGVVKELLRRTSPNSYGIDWMLNFYIATELHTLGGTTRGQREDLRRAENLLLQRQLPDGSWFSWATVTMLAAANLYDLGYSKNSQAIVDALRFLQSVQHEDGSVVPFDIPVWDTEIALMALYTSGVDRRDARVVQAWNWLKQARFPNQGWGFTPASGLYTDFDDTALAALVACKQEPSYAAQVADYLVSLQNDDGGWATYTQNYGTQRNVRWVPPDPLPGYMVDPSVPDVTGHVLVALGCAGYTKEDLPIQQAVEYLQRVQFDDGKWYGHWGIPYIYGTSGALMGLDAVGADMDAPYVRQAVEWLKRVQGADGGWGEGPEAKEDPANAGKGEETAIQTAWALLGLLAAHEPPDSDVIQRGVAYLLTHQQSDGSWPPAETMRTVTMEYMIGHDNVTWPLWALAEYRVAARSTSQDGNEPQ